MGASGSDEVVVGISLYIVKCSRYSHQAQGRVGLGFCPPGGPLWQQRKGVGKLRQPWSLTMAVAATDREEEKDPDRTEGSSVGGRACNGGSEKIQK